MKGSLIAEKSEARDRYLKETNMNNKATRDIILFAAGGSYDAIINTGIHAHPANKRGYPDKYTPFLLFRKKGGIMECVFRVKKTYDLIPSRLLTFPDDLTPKEKECLHKYLAFRRTEYAQRMKKYQGASNIWINLIDSIF